MSPEQMRTAKFNFRAIPTLLGAQIGDLEDITCGDICLVGLFEDHANERSFGSRFATRQLRYASYFEGLRLNPKAIRKVIDLGDLNVFPLERQRNDEVLKQQLKSILDRGGLPIIVGGDASISHAIKASLKTEKHQEIRIINLLSNSQNSEEFQSNSNAILSIELSNYNIFMKAGIFSEIENRISALKSKDLVAVHLFGMAPELDFTGRYEAHFGLHVLKYLVDHFEEGRKACI